MPKGALYVYAATGNMKTVLVYSLMQATQLTRFLRVWLLRFKVFP